MLTRLTHGSVLVVKISKVSRPQIRQSSDNCNHWVALPTSSELPNA
ncbi:hypothetical protein AB8H50_000118 [Vibrio parahaemolyticus]